MVGPFWLKHFDLIEKVAFVVFFHVHCCPFDKPLPDEHDERDARALLDDSIQGAKVPATISDPNTDSTTGSLGSGKLPLGFWARASHCPHLKLLGVVLGLLTAEAAPSICG
jgi:hypothetical protein